MADKYCDHGAYGAYSTIPTWGQAQDGDGTAKSAGTPSTAEIVFTGVPSSGSIAVLGVTLTVSWATSADNCANLLATAINAATGVATGPASFTTKSQVRNHIYARGPANGAPAGTCQIMTRQASASHAGLTAITHTLNNVSSPGTIAFTGGTGGCIGWLISGNSNIWPSNFGFSTYGLWCANAPFTSNVEPGDIVYIRGGKTINVGDTDFSISGFPSNTRNTPVNFIIDDGTQWIGDSSTSEFLINMNISYSQGRSIVVQNNKYFNIIAKRYSDTSYRLRIFNTSSFATARIGNLCSEIQGVCFDSPAGFGVTYGQDNQLIENLAHYKECLFKFQSGSTFFPGGNQYQPWKAVFSECIFDNMNNALPHPGLFPGNDGGGSALVINFYSCNFINFVAGSKLYTAGGINRNPFIVNYRNCNFGNISFVGPAIAQTSTNTNASVAAASSQFENRDFFIDTPYGFVEWNSSRGFPVLNAKLLDGVTGWSIRCIPTTVANRNSRYRYLELPRISKINTLGTGNKNIKVEIAIHESLNWTKSDISILIDYLDSDGNRRIFDSYDYSASPLDVSTSTWSNEESGKVVFVDGVSQLHNKYKFEISTDFQVLENTEIGFIIRCHSSVSDITKSFFIDPDIHVSNT